MGTVVRHEGTHNLKRTGNTLMCTFPECPYSEYSPQARPLDPEPFMNGPVRSTNRFPGSILNPRNHYDQDIEHYPRGTKEDSETPTAPLTTKNIRDAIADLPDGYVVTEDLLNRLIGKTPLHRKAVEITYWHLKGRASATRSTVEAAVEEALATPNPQPVLSDVELEEQVRRAAMHYAEAAQECGTSKGEKISYTALRNTLRWLIQNGARV